MYSSSIFTKVDTNSLLKILRQKQITMFIRNMQFLIFKKVTLNDTV